MNSDTGEGRFAGFYDIAFNPVLRKVHHSILQLTRKYHCHSVIDLGSGTGAQARVLANHGLLVTGIDVSSQMIQVAQKKSQSTIRFIQSDITEFSNNDSQFDAVNICLVLHPNAVETIITILDIAKKLVAPDGVVLITDYGLGTGFSGKIANGIIKVIESLAKENHSNNYASFMKQNGIEMLSTLHSFKIIEKKKYYHGALQTFVLSISP